MNEVHETDPGVVMWIDGEWAIFCLIDGDWNPSSPAVFTMAH